MRRLQSLTPGADGLLGGGLASLKLGLDGSLEVQGDAGSTDVSFREREGIMGPHPGPKPSRPSLLVPAKYIPYFLIVQIPTFLLHCSAPAMAGGH